LSSLQECASVHSLSFCCLLPDHSYLNDGRYLFAKPLLSISGLVAEAIQKATPRQGRKLVIIKRRSRPISETLLYHCRKLCWHRSSQWSRRDSSSSLLSSKIKQISNGVSLRICDYRYSDSCGTKASASRLLMPCVPLMSPYSAYPQPR
jgi:hypothetical protein